MKNPLGNQKLPTGGIDHSDVVPNRVYMYPQRGLGVVQTMAMKMSEHLSTWHAE